MTEIGVMALAPPGRPNRTWVHGELERALAKLEPTLLHVAADLYGHAAATWATNHRCDFELYLPHASAGFPTAINGEDIDDRPWGTDSIQPMADLAAERHVCASEGSTESWASVRSRILHAVDAAVMVTTHAAKAMPYVIKAVNFERLSVVVIDSTAQKVTLRSRADST